MQELRGLEDREIPVDLYLAPHLTFLIETALGYDVIPKINGYRKLADPSNRMLNHGGVVAYVYNSLSTNILMY